jgi:hypothetical protein
VQSLDCPPMRRRSIFAQSKQLDVMTKMRIVERHFLTDRLIAASSTSSSKAAIGG